MRGWFLGLLLSFIGIGGIVGSAAGIGLEPENKLKAEFVSEISFNKETGAFVYEYTLLNAAGSQQSIWNVFMPLKGESDGFFMIEDLQGPKVPGSAGRSMELGTATVSWVIVDDAPWENENLPPPGMVKPGEEISGFSFKTRKPTLPIIQDFYASGWVRDITEAEAIRFFSDLAGKDFKSLDDVPEELVRGSFLAQPTHERVFRGKTVAPEVVSEDQLEPVSLTERLIAQKDEAASLGWIQDPGIVTSLNKKLEAALASLKREQTKAAAGTLRAFLNELEALRGKKHLNENAYWLLRANAEFLLSRLEEPWYKRMFR